MRRSKNRSKQFIRGAVRSIRPLSSTRLSILGIPPSKLCALTERTFDILLKISYLFFVIPFTRDDTGVYILGSVRRRLIFWVVYSIGLVAMFKNVFVVTSLVLVREGDLNIEALLCGYTLVAQLAGYGMSIASTFKPQETIDVVNSWSHVMRILKKIHGRKATPFDEVSSSMQVLAGILVAIGATIALSGTVILFPELRIWVVLDSVVRNGGQWLFPTWVWAIILLPLELMFFVPQLSAAAFNGCTFVIAAGVMRTFAFETRKIRVGGLVERRKVEWLCACFELSSTVINNWLIFTFPPVVLSFFFGIVITFYGSLRLTDLPLVMYIFLPFTGVTLMSLVLIVSYYTHGTLATINGVVATLMDTQAEYIKLMPKDDKSRLMKRAKAIRPFRVLLGPFGKFTINFPVDFWDEVINQVLFLLSF